MLMLLAVYLAVTVFLIAVSLFINAFLLPDWQDHGIVALGWVILCVLWPFSLPAGIAWGSGRLARTLKANHKEWKRKRAYESDADKRRAAEFHSADVHSDAEDTEDTMPRKVIH